MAFKLEVLVEPKDGTYCGACAHCWVPTLSSGALVCYVFKDHLTLNNGYAMRCKRCIAAEQAAKESK
jgi:hypothetical protein